jgi:cysteine desulfurase
MKPPTRIYFDYNATAPLRAVAREEMLAASQLIGNPSSVHAEGRAARASVEEARRSVAVLVGGEARNVTFLASGTEAANLATVSRRRMSKRFRSIERDGSILRR